VGAVEVVQASGVGGGLTRPEITRIVNRYIGVSGGYLGDFSYGSHSDFYPEYCDLDLNPFEYLTEGTTGERFIRVLEQSAPYVQAKIIRDVLEKYPPGSEPPAGSNASRKRSWRPRAPSRQRSCCGSSSKRFACTTAAGSSPPTGFRRRFAQYLVRWAVLGSNQ
jgi:hypothetical protein